ncbi:MAG: hypothetical protein QOF53_1921 [Nocardioidaceae bacterium]|nr:hypothetical protein [Nocardioidaceae bacterium]
MTHNEPESVNRWATEHYGFEDAGAASDTGGRITDPTRSTGAPGSDARPSPSRHPGRRRPGRAAMITSAVLSVALVSGIGGTAVASDAGHEAGHDGITHLDSAAERNDRGADRS